MNPSHRPPTRFHRPAPGGRTRWRNGTWLRCRDCWQPSRLSASRRELTTVTSHPQGVSPYGCLDMMGNAREWCNDTYFNDHNSTSANYLASGRILTRYLKDPDGDDAYSVGRVMKGTGFSLPIVHVSDLHPEDPWECSPFNGFRCVWHPLI